MYLLKESIKEEFQNHFREYHQDNQLKSENYEDWHQILFNSDYYIIGYYKTQMWLKKHDIDVLEALTEIQDYELNNFGISNFKDFDYESIVNMLVYILGEHWMNEEFENLKTQVFCES